ncbi:armadillo repeat-containing protein 2 isoform X2 [Ictalurus furcatus]|uniref:armadillo repeat-containing protein 2 isoform X2 n=1 Tax=Ictalurus furcatus TaxID=66913 RepID=UPI0023504438|nr:armadillo repeat-containing protein 2 isoform X2 [Ictalurus furcatus]
MASVERKQDEKGPFYLGYGSRRQTSAEIVTEARHSLRTLQTQRPFTPREEHRQLFGGSARTRDGRPPSSFSLHARNFEAPDSRPSSGTRLLPLEHKPRLPLSLDLDYSEVEKGLPKPPAERLDKRGSGSARTRLVRARSLTLVPSMTQHSNVPQTERVDKPTLGMTPSQQVHTESFYLHSGCKQERTEKSSEILTQKLTKHRYSILSLVSLFRFHPLLVFVLLFISCQNFFLPITATWRAVENLDFNGPAAPTYLKQKEQKQMLSVAAETRQEVMPLMNLSSGPLRCFLFCRCLSLFLQVTGALRNMADLSESRSSFLSDDVFSTLCAVMDHRQEDEDICLNVARIFSKLSSYAECCYALAETSSCYRLFLALLCKHSRKQALVVRLLFTLGNLAARSNDARERVYEEERSIDILLELFQSYLQVSKNPPNSENYTQEDEDVLIKLIRVLANLSIHPTVGTALAANTLFVQLLLKVMELRSVEKSTELVVNASTAINNLSYYQGESSIVRIQHAHVSQLLLQLLLSTNTDAVLEAIRVFGNLSQIEEVQQFIITNKVLQFVVALLDSKNPDMCFSACGVLTNLSVDPKNRTVINEEGATPKLIDCLRDFGPQDWLLATQVCQTLWNCTEDREQDYAQELCTILSLYSDPKALQWPSSDDMKAYQEACWELEFLPVAERLKKRMQRYVNIPEPVSEPSRSRIPEVRPYKK